MKWALLGLAVLLVVAVGVGLSGTFFDPPETPARLPAWVEQMLSRPIARERVAPECRPLAHGPERSSARCLVFAGAEAGDLTVTASVTCAGAKVRFDPAGDTSLSPGFTLRLSRGEKTKVRVPEAGASFELRGGGDTCAVWLGDRLSSETSR